MLTALHFTLTLKYYKSHVLIDHYLKLNKLRNYDNYLNGLNTSIVKDTNVMGKSKVKESEGYLSMAEFKLFDVWETEVTDFFSHSSCFNKLSQSFLE